MYTYNVDPTVHNLLNPTAKRWMPGDPVPDEASLFGGRPPVEVFVYLRATDGGRLALPPDLSAESRRHGIEAFLRHAEFCAAEVAFGCQWTRTIQTMPWAVIKTHRGLVISSFGRERNRLLTDEYNSHALVGLARWIQNHPDGDDDAAREATEYLVSGLSTCVTSLMAMQIESMLGTMEVNDRMLRLGDQVFDLDAEVNGPAMVELLLSMLLDLTPRPKTDPERPKTDPERPKTDPERPKTDPERIQSDLFV